jgi:hypothetical protein
LQVHSADKAKFGGDTSIDMSSRDDPGFAADMIIKTATLSAFFDRCAAKRDK